VNGVRSVRHTWDTVISWREGQVWPRWDCGE